MLRNRLIMECDLCGATSEAYDTTNQLHDALNAAGWNLKSFEDHPYKFDLCSYCKKTVTLDINTACEHVERYYKRSAAIELLKIINTAFEPALVRIFIEPGSRVEHTTEPAE